MEALHLLTGKREVRGVQVFVNVEFLHHHVATHPDAPGTIVVVHPVVDVVLVYAFLQQMTDDEEDFGTRGVVGKAASVGHHPAIDVDGTLLAHGFKFAQLPQNAEGELTS